MRPCPDCGVSVGQPHDDGCAVERCPLCKGQLITCGCIYKVNGMDRGRLKTEQPEIYHTGPTESMFEVFEQEVERRGGFLVWTGEWPGTAECRERGWFCQDGHGYHSRFGSFCPCAADDPGAMADMNRLAHFRATGKDDLYLGCERVPRR